MTPRRAAALAVALVAAVPRLGVLAVERGDILAAFTDKGDDFARTFLASGTYGFLPDEPSAYTQPLYGFFLVPLYWLLERSWLVVGLAHVAVAVATALLVLELGRRIASLRVGVVAAVAATLSPYLVWHDVHMNREILDGLLAVAIVLLTVLAAERPTWLRGGALGLVLGVAVLGNVRLLALPLVLGGYLLWQRGRTRELAWCAGALAGGFALVLVPWVARNQVSVGCAAITTDARALWKANNPNTYDTLARGGWIDHVPALPGAPPTPQDAYETFLATGRRVAVDECAQMRFYRGEVLDFWRDEPGEKGRLAVQAAGMLWQPRVTQTEGRPGEGTWLDDVRAWAQPLHSLVLFVLGLGGLALLERRVRVLFVALLAYQTVMAMLFVGATRYRVPWDFLLALPAAAAFWWLLDRLPLRDRFEATTS